MRGEFQRSSWAGSHPALPTPCFALVQANSPQGGPGIATLAKGVLSSQGDHGLSIFLFTTSDRAEAHSALVEEEPGEWSVMELQDIDHVLWFASGYPGVVYAAIDPPPPPAKPDACLYIGDCVAFWRATHHDPTMN